MKKITILDGYVDEPSCLGVPPYLSPYARNVYGALLAGGLEEKDIDYVTIDEVRAQASWFETQADRWVLVVGGTTVPGRYLGGSPMSLKEMRQLPKELSRTTLWLMGPVVDLIGDIPGYDRLVKGSGAHAVYAHVTGEALPFSTSSLGRFACLGAGLISRHPSYPYVMVELETYRGCPRESHCLFCSEGYASLKYERQVEEILAEVEALGKQGARYFRLGAQPDLFSYKKGNVQAIERLYMGIRERVPALKVLHMDNANPRSVVANPEMGRRILQIVTRYNTPGDIVSLGLESAHVPVLEANNVGTTPEECLQAIQRINEVGSGREGGIPRLLPGLNFLHGLQGETEETGEVNIAFLQEILKEGLLLRRINIRQVIGHGGYRAKKVRRGWFQAYKERINREINQPMLKKVFPTGTVIEEVLLEKREGHLTYGRPLGTYPPRIGIPGSLPLGTIQKVKVVDHGFRSLTGVIYPFSVNRASLEELKCLPGIGDRRAKAIILARPFKDAGHLYQSLGEETVSILFSLLDAQERALEGLYI